MSSQIEQAYIESAIPNREVSSKILDMIDAFDNGSNGSSVTSVNGQQGIVVLDADDLADGSVNQFYTEAKVNANVNPKILNLQLQVNTKAANVLPTASQYVYVNYLVGNNTSGNGSDSAPFKTISAAMDSITDASEDKPYVIGLLASKQIETSNIFVKPYVSIVGLGQRATYVSATGFNIKPHGLHTTNKSWNLLKNFYLGGSTGIDWDLLTLGGDDSTLVVENMTIAGSSTFKGRAIGNNFLEIYNCNFNTNLTVDNLFTEFRDSKVVGNTSFNNSSTITDLISSLSSITFKGSLTVDSTDIELNNCAYPMTASLTTSGEVTVHSYRGVPPVARQTLSLNTTLNEYSETSSSTASENYIRVFNNTSDWILDTDLYELSVLVSAHNKGINPQVQTFELNGSNFEEVTCNTTIDSSGNVKIKIPQQSPDLRFNGKIILS